VRVVKLEQNYRSTNTILNAANAVIRNNTLRRGKRLWSQNGDGARITLNLYPNEEEEARNVVEQIEFNRLAHRLPWLDHAILFRTNVQSRPLETALRQAQVRYHLIGGQSFFDRREIRDFLAYLKAFVNPNDDISLLRIANVPARGLSELTMERLLGASHERKCSVFAVMKNPVIVATFQSKTQEAIGSFVALIERVRGQLYSAALARDPKFLAVLTDRFLDEIGYYGELRRSEKNKETAEGRVRNLKELVATLDEGHADKPPFERLEGYLEDVTLDAEREEEEENTGDAVTLITMHSCKGLEFPHVFIVGMEEGLLPHARSKEENTLDEERRLFYVAITRAKKTLSISQCETRKKYGAAIQCHPSSFLNELPEHLVEHADEKARTPVKPDTGKSLFDAMRSAIE
jgi:superfamily I DNA/RNA helicase